MKLQVLQDDLKRARLSKTNRAKRIQMAHQTLNRFIVRQKNAVNLKGERIRH